MMKILIITEGSEKHGLGHLNRVKSFVVSNNASGHDIKIIAMIDTSLKNLFSEIQNSVIIENNNQKIINYTKTFKADVVIFDLLKADKELFCFFQQEKVPLVSFSPIFNYLDKVDCLFTRGSLPTLSGVKVFSGKKYVIIGNHVEKIADEQYRSILFEDQLPIAIAMGGTDAPNKTLKILKGIKKFNKSLFIWVLLGEGYSHSYTQLVNEIKHNSLHEIVLARTNRSMWKILKNTVFFICAGGLTAYEAAYAGLPTITIVEKESHLALLDDLFKKECAVDGGTIEELSSSKIIEMIDRFHNNRELVHQMRLNCSNIIDLNGSINIMRELESLISK